MKDLNFGRVGFILAAAGSAVGLGNIWKFPYIAGDNGGGAFVLVYLVTVLLIGLPVLISEMIVGNMANKEPVSAYEHLAPSQKKYWRFAGFSLFTGTIILSFYAVVIGWIFYYIFITITALPSNVKEAEILFMGMLKTDITLQILFFSITLLIIAYIVEKGIKKGIEKINLILMPTLIIILLVMFFYSMSLDSFGKAVEFMFAPNWEKLTPYSILIAVGHAFFTLSIGMAAIMTYASFSNKHTNILKASLWVVALDTGIALIAGVMMFAFMFDFGLEPSKGPGLVFISLPATFYQLGFIGNVFSLLFFIALLFASITSAISILEPAVAYFNQRYAIARKKAVYSITSVIYIIGIIALLSNTKEFRWLEIFHKNIFDLLDFYHQQYYFRLVDWHWQFLWDI